VEILGVLFLTTDSGLSDDFIAVRSLSFDFPPQKTWAHLHPVSKAACLTVAEKTEVPRSSVLGGLCCHQGAETSAGLGELFGPARPARAVLYITCLSEGCGAEDLTGCSRAGDAA